MKKNFYTCAFFFCVVTTFNASKLRTSGCLNKEEAISMLKTADDFLSKANDVYPKCNQSECGGKLPLTYIEISRKLISDVRKNFPTSPNVSVQHDKPRDCSDILANGRNESGVYTIWPSEPCTIGKPLQVYCDMDTNFGGWTMIQRRGKYPIQLDFYQDWETYKNGFGNISEEFWLGNENIRVLCYKGCELRFDLQAKNGSKGYAFYGNFNLTRNSYKLYVSNYRGTAGDGMQNLTDYPFSTKDKGIVEKARQYQGGWWYTVSFTRHHLNGIYQPDVRGISGVKWGSWQGIEHLSSAEIKVRPK